MKQKNFHDPLGLLKKLLDHPHGLELANVVYQLHKDLQTDTQSNSQLVAIALNQAKTQGLNYIPYFKQMTNDEIRMWITQNS
ncbi:hypothetical protein [Nostoc sp. 'Peltigera malacea cyanobiont' DB3992]|uniref:hypothetical protein n=1 Tax=Nostoc sp. 'Peltigera malacea cyanobiont' DB3992 TaxID=1206980 RepID=UPI000C051301|nr:hypothetical protein [Nostoc sp. 'Peltigera malacea cyanobiont' DB3992]PHM08119.1 hypothetical protein CK516_22695 [Nostoc sp. 'Peltigera malacea cyanobiont' DB3992]